MRLCEVCVQNGLHFATTGSSTGCRQSFYGGRGGPTSVELEHHPHSAILLPVTFWLFPKLKSTCQGCRFFEIKDFRNMWQQCWNFSERVPLRFSCEHSYLRGILRRWPLSLSCIHTETFAIKSWSFFYWKQKKIIIKLIRNFQRSAINWYNSNNRLPNYLQFTTYIFIITNSLTFLKLGLPHHPTLTAEFPIQTWFHP